MGVSSVTRVGHISPYSGQKPSDPTFPGCSASLNKGL